MSGFIKLHREIFESDIWHDVTTFRLFLYLIGQASHQDDVKYKGQTLNKGQFIRSYRKLTDDLSYKEGRGYKKYSLSTIKRSVNKLVTAERVNVNETELGTLFTIVNYDRYQQNETVRNKLRTPLTRNMELTQNEPRTNPEQYQEGKEGKKVKKKDLKPLSDSDDFDHFWNLYPRRLKKKDSQIAFKALLKAKASLDDVLTATGNYVASVQGKEQEYIMHPTTFLRKDRWKDYLNPVVIERPKSQYQRTVDELDEMYQEALFDGQSRGH